MASSRNFFSFDDEEEDPGRLRGSTGGATGQAVDADWEESNIRGFSFDDDDPFEGLNK